MGTVLWLLWFLETSNIWLTFPSVFCGQKTRLGYEENDNQPLSLKALQSLGAGSKRLNMWLWYNPTGARKVGSEAVATQRRGWFPLKNQERLLKRNGIKAVLRLAGLLHPNPEGLVLRWSDAGELTVCFSSAQLSSVWPNQLAHKSLPL